MTSKEFMEHALAGKKLRHNTWIGSRHIYLDLQICKFFEKSSLFYPTIDDNWELYEEPKKKKQVWQWRSITESSKEWVVYTRLLTEDEAERVFKNKFGNRYEKHAGPFEVDDI